MSQLKIALRTLAKTPIVTFFAIISLAFGIGANSALYSLFHQMLQTPLPVDEPGRLVNVEAPGPKSGMNSCNTAGPCDAVFSYPMFLDLEREASDAVALAGHRSFGVNLAFAGQSTISGQGMLVSGSYFQVLGLQPAHGRLIGPDDTVAIGAGPVAVLSFSYWRSHFGSDPDVLGQTLTVNGQPLTIIGVAPEGFKGTTLGNLPKIYVPMSLDTLESPGAKYLDDRRGYWVYVFGRLRDDVDVLRATLALQQPFGSILREVEAPLQEGMSETSLEKFVAKQIVLRDGARGQSSMHSQTRVPLLLLFAVAGVVLLIACANIANLLLARAASRAGEMAVRMSMGASRRRLIGQLLTEACILAVLGGLAGLLVAHWTLGLIGVAMPEGASEMIHFALDPKVVLFAAGLSVVTGLFFGIFPALQATGLELSTVLRAQSGQSGKGGGTRSASRFRFVLVTAQIALSTALLVSAGLFAKSLLNVSRIDLGLDVEQVVTLSVSPYRNGYDEERTRELIERAGEQIAAVPGVTHVAASQVPLLASSNWRNSVSIEGFEAEPDNTPHANFNAVGPGYFDTFGMALLAGRDFTEADSADRPKVAIVNEVFAESFGLGRDAVGKRMAVGSGEELDIEIVGVVQNAKYSEVKDEIPALYFVPFSQQERIFSVVFYARSAVEPRSLLSTLGQVMADIDPTLPVEELKTMPQVVKENLLLDRFLTSLSAGFALLATLLAAVGLYGVLAYTVTQRSREFGLRMALGANGFRVCRLVLAQVGKMTLVGGVLGIAAAIGIGRLAHSQLYDVPGYDPAVLVVSVLFLVVTALAAGLGPAWRAAQVDPMETLRYE